MSDQRITVWAENFVCERESTEASSSDEVYFDFYACTSSGANATLLSQVFTSVDAGETHGFTGATLWQQTVPADGLTVIALAWEEDQGISEADRRQRLQSIVTSQYSGSAEGLTLAQQISENEELWAELAGRNYSNMGTGDDTIGGYVFRIPATGLGRAWDPSTFEAVIDGSGRGETRVRLRLRACQGSRLVRLINVHSGKALTVHGATSNDGANVDQWTYQSGANQHWSLENTPNGYKLINVNSGKALTVEGAYTHDGANVDQWTYYPGQANQHWRLEDTGNGYKLTSVHSGKVLSVTGWSTDDGGNVLQWADESGAHQRWHIQDV